MERDLRSDNLHRVRRQERQAIRKGDTGDTAVLNEDTKEALSLFHSLFLPFDAPLQALGILVVARLLDCGYLPLELRHLASGPAGAS